MHPSAKAILFALPKYFGWCGHFLEIPDPLLTIFIFLNYILFIYFLTMCVCGGHLCTIVHIWSHRKTWRRHSLPPQHGSGDQNQIIRPGSRRLWLVESSWPPLYFYFWKTISHCSQGWPGTHTSLLSMWITGLSLLIWLIKRSLVTSCLFPKAEYDVTLISVIYRGGKSCRVSSVFCFCGLAQSSELKWPCHFLPPFSLSLIYIIFKAISCSLTGTTEGCSRQWVSEHRGVQVHWRTGDMFEGSILTKSKQTCQANHLPTRLLS